MKREEILDKLHDNHAAIGRFRVKSLALFGSFARNEATASSDIDTLVEFDGPATYDQYIDLKHFLEDELGCKVDLVMTKALHARLRSAIEREAIRVA